MCYFSFSLFHPTLFEHTPQLLGVPNHMPSQINQVYYQDRCKSLYLIDQTHYQSASWAFKSRFSFKVIQPGKQQLYLKYKVCWIFYKMVGVLSFSYPYWRIQPPLESPPKIHSLTSANFHLPNPPFLVHKIILTIPQNTPLRYTSAIFHLIIFTYSNPCNIHQKYFAYLNHLANSGCVKGPVIEGVLWERTLFQSFSSSKCIDRNNRD